MGAPPIEEGPVWHKVGLIRDYIQSSPDPQRERPMRYSSQVKPISYLKANAAEVLANLSEQREPLVITQNGEAKAVLQDVASFEETQETLALLKILALGNRDLEAGRVKPAAEVVARLRAKRASG
jgi:prevent-host-death family protein